jgi:hypothetical protein|tara:strand:+ start:3897 stop:4361 length:465 start_codon:yes stop_codon:yes gene_type:complete
MSTYKPISPDKYEGKQAIINSDRILFNAKDDSILLFSDKSIGFSTNGSIHFDTSDKVENSFFIVNTPKIYLGMSGDNYPTEPALLGNKTEKWLNEMLDVLRSTYIFLATQYSVTVPVIGTSAPAANDFSLLYEQIDRLTESIEGIKSKNIFLKE